MIKIRTFGLLVLVSAALVSGRSALAAQPYLGGAGTWFPGYGYNIYGMESVPYFALHPPVYYTRPVGRPYGWSPFAYPPGTLTPDVEFVAPQVITNPHVQESSSTTSGRVAEARPLRVTNPYVNGSESQLSQTP